MSRTAAMGVALAIGCGLGACAPSAVIIEGREVPRRSHHFTGQPYEIDHKSAHPRPKGPSSGTRGDGGSITGRVCGLDIAFDVTHQGDHLQLIGFLDGSHGAQLQVRDAEGARHITGALASLSVDLRITSTLIQGHSGLRVISAEVDPDRHPDVFLGFVRVPNWTGPHPALITGREALWGLPAADQGVLLPLLLTCQIPASDQGIYQPLSFGFGGEATSTPSMTSTIYNPRR